MPNHTVSTNVDTMLRAADNATIRTAIGVGTTDAITALSFVATGSASGNIPAFGNGTFGIEFFSSASRLMIREGPNTVAAFGNPASGVGLIMSSTKPIGWSNVTPDGTYDLTLLRDAAGILAQRNGVNAQAFRVYNTFPGTGNNEWGGFDWQTTANTLRIGTALSGTGVGRGVILAASGAGTTKIFGGPSATFSVQLMSGGGGTSLLDVSAGTSEITSNANLKFAPDNTYDIGTGGANRPRNVFVANTLSVGGNFNCTNMFSSGSLAPIRLLDGTGNDFSRLQLGGTTSSFPAIKRNGTGIDIRLADDSAYTRLIAGSLGLGTANPVADLDIADTWNAPAITVTGASGNGTTATITFATQVAAIQVGATIVVAGINPSGYNGTFVVTASSVTSVSYLNATSAAWVSGGTIERLFTSVKLNVTDTASNAASLLMDLQKGGITQLSVSKTGSLSGKIESNLFNQNAVNINGALFGSQLLGIGNSILINAANVGIGISLGSGFPISWSSNAGSANYADFNIVDLQLRRDGPGILAQRTGVNAQAFRVYNTYTDASNYDRLSLLHSGGQATIVAEGAGTGSTSSHLTLKAAGTTRAIIFNTAGSDRWAINSAGNLAAQADNTYDIGANGANRPKNIYVAQTVRANAFQLNATSHIYGTVDGIIGLYNNALNNFDRLQLGGSDNTFPAIARDGAGIKFTGAAAGSTSWIKVPAVAVSALPSAATAGAGARSFVNDALSPVFGSAVTGGGGVFVPVYSTGTAWNVG
jgi:hypothetical protein